MNWNFLPGLCVRMKLARMMDISVCWICNKVAVNMSQVALVCFTKGWQGNYDCHITMLLIFPMGSVVRCKGSRLLYVL